MACAASLAVQKVIASENLLDNCRELGGYLGKLLRERLQGPNAVAAPFIFDIRGGGLFWGVEFDFVSPQAATLDFKGELFCMILQARCFENGLVVMAFNGGANLEGTEGHHAILSPAYNVTREQVEKIVDIFVESVEQVLADCSKH
jgi:E3 ubiquitin-protein ligase TRIP12